MKNSSAKCGVQENRGSLAALPACSSEHWHCMALHDGATGFEESDALSDAFIAAGEPADMAVFLNRDHDNGFSIHWFSPAAHFVATQQPAR